MFCALNPSHREVGVKAELQARLRQLPAVDRVLVELRKLTDHPWPQDVLTGEIQQAIAELRRALLADQLVELSDCAALARQVVAQLHQLRTASLKKVLNVSGVLLHTNLGRAPLAAEALDQIQQVAAGYSNLELNLETGRRGSRHRHVEDLLCRLSGSEAALVVNNNAGAILLALSALGRGREAIVSRGELVEIGGSFRIPEVMETGGVMLREVGSSNRTHLDDYRRAIGPQTALLLKVHTSNYRIIGFTRSVSAAELVPLAREHELPVIEDLGSGLLRALPNADLPLEPTIAETVAAGVDLVTCSGDKLLGGPQAGLIFGRRQWVQKLRTHPLARALRIDKLSLAALEATLGLYVRGEELSIPLLAFLASSKIDLEARCRHMQSQLVEQGLQVELIEDYARVGGGAMPEAQISGPALRLSHPQLSAEHLAQALRQAETPVIGRIQEDFLLLNLRSLPVDDDPLLVQTLRASLARALTSSSVDQ